MLGLSYVLPIRWDGETDLDEMTGYLRVIARIADVIVVDNSAPAVFERNHRAWASVVRHVAPDARYAYRNGKVNNVLTGITLAQHDRVVIADDDVRYDADGLRRIAALLDDAELVVPQNYFDPRPWHAVLDTARTLINRSFWHDFPGTLGVRKRLVLAAGGYDGDVLFENLELLRTVDAMGGRVRIAPDLLVRRLPPTTRRFWAQRVRQAYDEFARPVRLVVWCSVLPTVAWLAWTRRWVGLAVLALLPVLFAEIGRRKGGERFFPARATLFAPVWVLERSVSSWLAVAARVFFGGVRYGDGRLARAATPTRTLRARFSSIVGDGEQSGRVSRSRAS